MAAAVKSSLRQYRPGDRRPAERKRRRHVTKVQDTVRQVAAMCLGGVMKAPLEKLEELGGVCGSRCRRLLPSPLLLRNSVGLGSVCSCPSLPVAGCLPPGRIKRVACHLGPGRGSRVRGGRADLLEAGPGAGRRPWRCARPSYATSASGQRPGPQRSVAGALGMGAGQAATRQLEHDRDSNPANVTRSTLRLSTRQPNVGLTELAMGGIVGQ